MKDSVERARPRVESATRAAYVVSPSIIVAIRKRPRLAVKEADDNDIVRGDSSKHSVVVYEPRTKLDLTPVIEPSFFSFDHVFDETSTNEDVYEECCHSLLQNVRDGGGAVVFAFGQTGSGKTHTMLGGNGNKGLYILAVTELLEMPDLHCLSVSFFEVYGTKLFDLLNDRTEVKMLQDEYKNIHIVGLTEREARSVDDIQALMSTGQLLRASGTTHANDRSSRSHAVLEIKAKFRSGEFSGRITFVDLAGSERASDTAETDAKTRREGAEINKSLLALKECIRAMSMRRKHIQFRGSKLTQILRESFVGRCRTCVIANISPCQRHCEDTLNTLRYADRIKELKSSVGNTLAEAPIACHNCGLPIFVGDRHVCKRQVVQCPYCRQEMDKCDLEGHIAECKEVPIRCPYCNERMLRSEVSRHNRRCARLRVQCPECNQFVPRNMLEKHILTECGAAKAKCRYCRGVFLRQELPAHELSCDSMKMACMYCLKFVKKSQVHDHQMECLRNPNRNKVGTREARLTSRQGSPSFSAASGSVSRETSQGPQEVVHSTTADGHTSPKKEIVSKDCKTTQKYVGQKILSQRSSLSNSENDLLGGCATLEADDGPPSLCPFFRYGCPAKVSRLNLPAHLSESMEDHLELVTSYADKVEMQNAELRRFVVEQNGKAADPSRRRQIGLSIPESSNSSPSRPPFR